jgi:hypothetical protein
MLGNAAAGVVTHHRKAGPLGVAVVGKEKNTHGKNQKPETTNPKNARARNKIGSALRHFRHLGIGAFIRIFGFGFPGIPPSGVCTYQATVIADSR